MQRKPPASRAGTGEQPDPTPRGRKSASGPAIRLANADDVRVELAKLYRDARRGRVDAGHATKLAFILGLMLKACEQTVIERRLDALELEPPP